MILGISEQSFVAFVDDTGHEELIGDHLVFGLGGCGAIGGELDKLIRDPWRKVREAISGSPDTPLHAAKFTRTAKPRDIETVAQFFHENHFARFGTIVKKNSTLDSNLSPARAVAGTLKKRLVEVASWTSFIDMKVVFESSQRGNKAIEGAFDTSPLLEGTIPIPLECFFMPKTVGEPALEVADFIVHAIGRQIRRKLRHKSETALDFAAVFHSVPSRFTSFMEIDSAVAGP